MWGKNKNMNLNKFKEYNNNPKKCLWCEKIIPYEKRNNNYCNLSHSSKKHNENIKNKTFEEIYGKEKSDIIKNKLSQKLTGRSLTEEHKARIKQAEVGRQITWGDKISNSLIGRKLSNKHINSLKENHVGMTGLNHTEKTKNKMSKIKIGKNNPMYGRKLSNETKIKMRKSAIRHIEKFRGKVKTNVGKTTNTNKRIIEIIQRRRKYKYKGVKRVRH